MLIGLNHLPGNMPLPSVAGAWGLSKARKRQTVGVQSREWPWRCSQEEEGVKLAAEKETPPHFHPRADSHQVLAPEFYEQNGSP